MNIRDVITITLIIMFIGIAFVAIIAGALVQFTKVNILIVYFLY